VPESAFAYRKSDLWTSARVHDLVCLKSSVVTTNLIVTIDPCYQ
jgi:hypothetical protein